MADQGAADRVLYVSTRISLTLSANRYVMLKRQGFDVEVTGWERLGYERPVDTSRLPSGQFSVLGAIRDRSVLGRCLTLLRSLPRLRRLLRRSDLVVVNGGPEIALTVMLAGLLLRRPLVRDVSDVHPVGVGKGLKARLFRMAEKAVAARCRLLVLTSGEYERYIRDWLKADPPVIVVENKLDPELALAWRNLSANAQGVSQQRRDPGIDQPLRVGWFGLIRDRWCLELVEHLVQTSGGMIEFVLAGEVDPGLPGFPEFVERNPAVEYLGIFSHPGDMPGLYAQVDMSLACYSPRDPFGWSLSCRYYDSCAFRTPLICRAGTGDAPRVERHGLGIVLRSDRPEDAAEEFGTVTVDDLARWRAAMDALEPAAYAYTGEVETLAGCLKLLAGGVLSQAGGLVALSLSRVPANRDPLRRPRDVQRRQSGALLGVRPSL